MRKIGTFREIIIKGILLETGKPQVVRPGIMVGDMMDDRTEIRNSLKGNYR